MSKLSIADAGDINDDGPSICDKVNIFRLFLFFFGGLILTLPTIGVVFNFLNR